MMSLSSTLNAITEVQNVESQQTTGTTKNVSSINKTSDKSTSLNNDFQDKTLSKLGDKKVNNKFDQILSKIKLDDSKNNPINDFKKAINKLESKSKDSSKIKLDNIEELEEKIENLTDDQLLQCLNIIGQFLNNNFEPNEDLNLQNLDLSKIEDITNSLKTSLMEVINNTDKASLETTNMSANDLIQNSSDVLKDMLKVLNSTDINEKVDTNALKFVEKLVSEVSARVDNNDAVNKDTNSELMELLAGTKNRIEELLNSNMKADNELTLHNNSLNNIYKNVFDDSNSNNDNSSQNEGSNNQNFESSKTKDDKVLDSILSDKSSNNTIPVFTTNTVVNNATGVVVETKQVVNAGSMVQDVIQNVKYMETNDMREMIVKVNPGNLGEITIKLVEENGVMKLHMKATSKETYGLLMQQSSDIKNQLSDQNIKIQDVNISLYEEDTTFFKDGEFHNAFDEQKGNKGKGKNNAAHGTLEDDEDSKEDNDDLGVVNMLA